MSHLSSFFSAVSHLAHGMSFELLTAVVAVAVIASFFGPRGDFIGRNGRKKP
jgi:hypothetical protein